jgi:hypothetical protein
MKNRPEPKSPAARAARPAEPKKRFRLERLEERIAPKGHYNPQSKFVGIGNQGGATTTIY